jgi:hypothetical protein
MRKDVRERETHSESPQFCMLCLHPGATDPSQRRSAFASGPIPPAWFCRLPRTGAGYENGSMYEDGRARSLKARAAQINFLREERIPEGCVRMGPHKSVSTPRLPNGWNDPSNHFPDSKSHLKSHSRRKAHGEATPAPNTGLDLSSPTPARAYMPCTSSAPASAVHAQISVPIDIGTGGESHGTFVPPRNLQSPISLRSVPRQANHSTLARSPSTGEIVDHPARPCPIFEVDRRGQPWTNTTAQKSHALLRVFEHLPYCPCESTVSCIFVTGPF